MKNFSAKNAEFETVTINNEAAISSADLGTAPNQIPLNKDLGSLAYQDAVNLDDVSADMLELRAIAAEISDSAVDVFVYDTSRDSDGGAWRKRTQHTSWYNEELNTATRGGRREFPAVAVIVAESGNVKKLKIYDGDDPDLPLWMSFEASGLGSALGRVHSQIFGISSVYMLNGLLCVTGLGSSNNVEVLCQISFIDDLFWQWHKYGFGDAGISERNETHSISSQEYRGRTDEPMHVHSYHDVAMTVLPNAPIDQNTGLPVPTIAVATDGGVSVIKDDGTVVDITATNVPKIYEIAFSNDYKILFRTSDTASNENDYVHVYEHQILSSDINYLWYYSMTESTGIDYSYPYDLSLSSFVDGRALATKNEEFTLGTVQNGAVKVYRGSTDSNESMVVHTTSKYNTGWMPGDIKLATLSDTTVETIGESSDELITNGDFSTDATAANFSTTYPNWGTWYGTCSVEDNKLSVIVSGSEIAAAATTNFPTVVGQRYVVSFDYGYDGGASHLAFWIDDTNATGQADIYNSGDILSTDPARSRSVSFTATSTTTYLVFLAYGTASSNASGEFYNISVRATTELITNGDFSSAIADDGVGWEYKDDGTSSYDVVDGVLTLSHTTYTNSMLYQILDLVAGKQYVLTAQTGGTNYDLCNVRIGSSLGGDQFGSIVSSEALSSDLIDNVITFIPTQSTTYISLRINSSSPDLSCDFDNISVRLAEPDRSVNDNGLQVFGEITKTPVAPGADLVAYSGFSAENYLMQPYNSDLLDIDSHAVIGWCKVDSTTTEQTFFTLKSGGENAYGLGDTWTLMGCSGDGRLFIQTLQNDTSNFVNNGIVENTGSWHHFCFIVSGSELVIYKDGVFIDSAQRTTSGSLYLSDSQLGIGARISDARVPANNTSLCLMRLSTTIPTPEQIAKIYRDEKPLFQDGAQATLYGTSDAVTALAYDDSDDLLHVGTASGRSVFNGLKRIDNTTTAVSTAISATEGLVIEQ